MFFFLFTQTDPTYQELDPDQISTAYPEGPDGPVKIKVISGKSHGVESPVRSLGGCWYFHAIFDKKTTIFQDLRTCSDFISPQFGVYESILAKNWTSFIYSKSRTFDPHFYVLPTACSTGSLEGFCQNWRRCNRSRAVPHPRPVSRR